MEPCILGQKKTDDCGWTAVSFTHMSDQNLGHLLYIWELYYPVIYRDYTTRIQICPKTGISPTMLFWGWDVSTINPTQSEGFWILRDIYFISHYKDPYEPTIIKRLHKGFEHYVCLLGSK